MDIAFLGPYRQKDGWGKAAKDYLTALLLSGHNISSKPVFMAHSVGEPTTPEIEEAERRVFTKKPDIVIQNALPHYFDYQHGSYNIGISYFETSGWKQIGWARHINLLDEMWVSSHHEKNILLGEGITIPINVIPMPLDLNWINPNGTPIEIPAVKNTFVFYFIGEMIFRKNILGLVVAYHNEFGPSEQVSLVIKTGKMWKSPEEIYQQLQYEIGNVKDNIRIYQDASRYKAEYIITDFISPDELNGLHMIGDCLVNPSRGESLSRPIMEAMAMGNDVIVTDNTGMAELVSDCGGFMIDSVRSQVLVADPPLKKLYTSEERWYEPDLSSLQKQMRAVFESSKEEREQRSKLLKAKISNYSHESVARIMKERLACL